MQAVSGSQPCAILIVSVRLIKALLSEANCEWRSVNAEMDSNYDERFSA